ncbi:MAG: hypothetical protein EI684_12310 [Candidatus Viridilinea halotolerans]|uniref:Uncharacterized protein n=1 Tax=Candidatus Viridilinea halotolerans TaxID=2491704 RepID=A0A426TYA5_9CHLR|nr:MAG: hypothetical protein EI684_12310 [Candidatus Viridilinea halotolerans]
MPKPTSWWGARSTPKPSIFKTPPCPRSPATSASAVGQGEPYFLSIRGEHKPAGYVPAPHQAGDDRTRDNDMTTGLLPGTPLWATPVFWMPEDRRAVVTGIDIGLCRVETHTVYLPLVVR